jgi:hypothetical protein
MTIYDPPRGTRPTAGLAVDAGRRTIFEAVGFREAKVFHLGTMSAIPRKGFWSGILRSHIQPARTNPRPGKFVFLFDTDLEMLTQTRGRQSIYAQEVVLWIVLVLLSRARTM